MIHIDCKILKLIKIELNKENWQKMCLYTNYSDVYIIIMMKWFTDTWMTPQEQYWGVLMFLFLYCFFYVGRIVSFTSIVISLMDLAAMLFTPETPEVFSGL